MIRYLIIYIVFHTFLFSVPNNALMSNESFVTGEDGVVRMYVNLMGHVKNPGTYLMYDGIDFLTALSMGGGYLQGADLKNIIIYHQNGKTTKINFNNYLNSSKEILTIVKLLPHDTVFIEEKIISKFLTTSNLPYTILGLLNIAITLDKD